VIRNVFERKAGYEAEVLAEAQALLDDGLDLEFVLGLFPDDTAWLQDMLRTAEIINTAYDAEQPSYYFEASLKAKFLAGANAPREVAAPMMVPVPAYSPFRTAVATMSVASMAAAIGILSLGFITADNAVPGDWNYTFKLANERFEYTLSRGDGRVDVQLRQAEQRVLELQRASSKGNISSAQLESLQREVRAVASLATSQEFDEVQKMRVENLGRVGNAVFDEVKKQPSLDREEVDAAAAVFNDAVSTALGGVTTLPTPVATATATPTEPVTETPSPSATAEPTGTPTPVVTPTPEPSPTETATVTPDVTSTTQPTEAATEAASPTP